MAAISVTHNSDVQSPGLDISLTGLDSTPTWTAFRVVRRDLSGVLPDATVRGLDLQAQTAATAAGSDYEAPFSYYPLQYRLEMYTGTTLSTTVTFNLTGAGYFFPASTAMTTASLQLMNSAYLRSVDTPGLSQAVIVSDFRAYSRSGKPLSKSNVLGRANPVVSTDVTSGRTGTLDLIIGNFASAAQLSTQEEMDQLLSEGNVYMFQSVLSKSTGIKDLFFTIDSIGVERQQAQTAGIWGDLATRTSYLTDLEWYAPVLKYSIEWTEVDRPNTGDVGVSITTWQDVLNAYATWNDVLVGNASWLVVLQGTNYPH